MKCSSVADLKLRSNRKKEDGRHTFSTAVAMYGEEEDDLGAKVAEVASQAKQLSRVHVSYTWRNVPLSMHLPLHSTRPCYLVFGGVIGPNRQVKRAGASVVGKVL